MLDIDRVSAGWQVWLTPRQTRVIDAKLHDRDIAAGLDAETITLMRGGIVGDFIGFSVEEARQFRPDLFSIIDAAIAAQQVEEM